MEKFELCVIGGGPSGYAAVMRALDFGKKVLLIEKDKVGGAGVFNGALASKTMWELSKDILRMRRTMQKFSEDDSFHVDFKKIKQEVDQAVSERHQHLLGHINDLKEAGYKDIFHFTRGTGKLISKNEVEISLKDGGTEIIYAENIILATGSSPRYLPHIPIDEKIIVTSDGIHQWEELPKSMVVLGAGVIGCEYATIFSNLGQTQVNLIDKADRILSFEDDDIISMVEENFEKNGTKIHRNSSLERMEIVNGQVEYELSYTDGTNEIFTVEKALVSVGRVPNIKGLGLEEIGVQVNDRMTVIDNDTQTNLPNIYTVGDISADIALVNVGELEGRHAVKKIFAGAQHKLSYSNISSIMFLNPAVAAVGMNEKQARAKGISYQVASIDYACIPRAIAMRNPDGFFKILVTNDKDLKILGMRACGPQASSAIQGVALLINMGRGVQELAELIHPHPSLIEGIQECCRMLMGKSIFKPNVFKHMSYRGYMEGQIEEIAPHSKVNQ
jgi:dihydrolipoamide dehydrogenase